MFAIVNMQPSSTVKGAARAAGGASALPSDQQQLQEKNAAKMSFASISTTTELVQGKYIFLIETSSSDKYCTHIAVRRRDDDDNESDDESDTEDNCCCTVSTSGRCCNVLKSIFGSLPYVMFIVSLADAVFDFILVHQLVQYPDTTWMGGFMAFWVLIAFIFEISAKVPTLIQIRYDKKMGRGNFIGTWDYFILGMRNKMVTFFIEDTTTLYVWWETGTYNSEDPFARGNLITTLISALLPMAIIMYNIVVKLLDARNFISKDNVSKRARERCQKIAEQLEGDPSALSYMTIDKLQEYLSGVEGIAFDVGVIIILGTLTATAVIFWTWVGLHIIRQGDSRKCLGKCAENATDVTDSTAMGSGSGSGSEKVGKLITGLDNTVIYLYGAGIFSAFVFIYMHFNSGIVLNSFNILMGKDDKIIPGGDYYRKGYTSDFESRKSDKRGEAFIKKQEKAAKAASTAANDQSSPAGETFEGC